MTSNNEPNSLLLLAPVAIAAIGLFRAASSRSLLGMVSAGIGLATALTRLGENERESNGGAPFARADSSSRGRRRRRNRRGR